MLVFAFSVQPFVHISGVICFSNSIRISARISFLATSVKLLARYKLHPELRSCPDSQVQRLFWHSVQLISPIIKVALDIQEYYFSN